MAIINLGSGNQLNVRQSINSTVQGTLVTSGTFIKSGSDISAGKPSHTKCDDSVGRHRALEIAIRGLFLRRALRGHGS